MTKHHESPVNQLFETYSDREEPSVLNSNVKVKTTPKESPSQGGKWLSKKGRTVDTLALGADEGRDEHRYASGSCK